MSRRSQRVRMTRVGFGIAFLAGVVFAAASAEAGPIGFATWYEFGFGGVGSAATACGTCVPSSGTPTVFLDDPAWTFTAPAMMFLTVTDAFESGDRFEVFDFGASMGFTSLVSEGTDCGDDPLPCLADPDMSHAVFAVGAGDHSITIVATNSPFGTGAAYLQVGRVPEPGVAVLVGGGLAWIGARSRARRRA